MEIVSKLADALGMFWASLDERERAALVYVCCWLAASALLGLQSRRREQLKRQIVEEIRGGTGEA